MDNRIDLARKKELIRKQACFCSLNEEEIVNLSALLKEQHLSTGAVIVKEGDPVDSVYFISSGTADVRQIAIHDQSIEIKSIATLNEGQCIGLNETGFYSLSGRRTATVVALSDMVLLRLGVPEFHGFALAYPHVNEVMHKHAETLLNQDNGVD